MNDDRKFERNARTWLEFGPTDAPDRVVEAALLEIDQTSQERVLGIPRRLPRMSTPTRVLAAGTLVAAIGLGAVLAFTRPAHGPGTDGSPSPTSPVVSSTGRPSDSPSPSIQTLTESFRSDVQPLTFGYPAGWVASPAVTSYQTITQAVGDLEAYDRVEGDGSRFIVTSGVLSGQSFEDYLAARDAYSSGECHNRATTLQVVPIGNVSGFVTDDGCSSLGPYRVWWRAVALVEDTVFVFQLDTDRPAEGRALFLALLHGITIESAPPGGSSTP